MRSSVFFTAMMAAAVTATPVLKVIEEVETVTITIPYGQHAPTAAPAPAAKPAQPAAPAPASNGGSFEQHQPSKPAPSASSSSSQSSSGNDMLDVANKWRSKYGLPKYTWDESLIDNCDQTGKQNNGVSEKHLLIPNTNMGQVITPGQKVGKGDLKGLSPFEVAYLAWLCEVNTDPELQASANGGLDVCGVVQSTITMDYGGETGHHKILTDGTYTKIACSFTAANGQVDPNKQYQGLYVCDVSK